MNEKTLLELIKKTLLDKKAFDLTVLDVKKLTTVTDYFVICSATSSRHAKALSDHLQKEIKEQGVKPYGVEGGTSSKWILLDYLDIVVHIMLENTREFYDLESLWNTTQKSRKP